MERVDEKGKVFTPRVRTQDVEVHITTVAGKLHGFIHVAPGNRLKDQLNTRDEQFLALTNATSRSHEDKVGVHIDFIAINKQHIISVVPVDESRTTGALEGYYS